MLEFVALAPNQMVDLLEAEVKTAGANVRSVNVGFVRFEATLAQAYFFLLYSRIASRIGLSLVQANVTCVQDIKTLMAEVAWQDLLSANQGVQVKCLFSKDHQKTLNTHKVAKQLVELIDVNPSVYGRAQDLDILVFYHEAQAQICLDFAGGFLSKRGYRQQQTQASMKEQLAAAILHRHPPGDKIQWVLDPMCGVGTIVIEAAMLWAGIAPNLNRKSFAVGAWQGHDQSLWQRAQQEAQEAWHEKISGPWPDFIGFDADAKAIVYAKENAIAAGLGQKVRFKCQALNKFSPQHFNQAGQGYLIANPPYGERLGEAENLIYLYKHLGQKFSQVSGFKVVMSSNIQCLDALKLNYQDQHRFYNGPLPLFVRYGLYSEKCLKAPGSRLIPNLSALHGQDHNLVMDLANRLHKNYRKLKAWLDQPIVKDAKAFIGDLAALNLDTSIKSFRLYDADLPEFNFAVDCYEHCLHVQEYKPPKHLEIKAKERLQQGIETLCAIMHVPKQRIFIKTRQRQKGNIQYQRQSLTNHFFSIKEWGASLLVNLKDFTDTGIFLDHRLLRLYFRIHTNGKRFLNLFAYTGAASVHAALGGAKRSVSVDLSETYLQWARRNLYLNGLSQLDHLCVQADAFRFLQQTKEYFDVIFIDPPTFSNSKKAKDFDVQADHGRLIQAAIKRLSMGGKIFFSTNAKRFEFDQSLEQEYKVEALSHMTASADFSRSKQHSAKSAHHQCWCISL